MGRSKFGYYDFFAGGGMARLGLGDEWNCLLANDLSEKKARAYAVNFPPAEEYIQADVADLGLSDLPGEPVLAWASFPCQDLSLAGNRQGLNAMRSGTFWPFWKLIQLLRRDGRPIPIVVLENVVGAVTSHGGKDFYAILKTLASEGYLSGALILDAAHFLPHSRPRLFIVGIEEDVSFNGDLRQSGPSPAYHPRFILNAHRNLPKELSERWVWWRIPEPPPKKSNLIDLIEDDPTGTRWHSAEETQRLLELMSEQHRKKVRDAQAAGDRRIGTVYKRTRKSRNGRNVQRAEVRFDGTSGCLRTPAGGSSRQTILLVERNTVRSRLLSTREAARLMGVPESYALPANYNEAYHLMGDGLAVPVVRWLQKHVLSPLAKEITRASVTA